MIMRYNEEYNCFVGFVILSKKKKTTYMFWMRNFNENFFFLVDLKGCRHGLGLWLWKFDLEGRFSL